MHPVLIRFNCRNSTPFSANASPNRLLAIQCCINNHKTCNISVEIITLQQESPTYGPRATIRPTRRFYAARRNVKNDRFVSIRCVFSSSKIRQNSFSAGALGGAYDAPQMARPPSWLGRGTPPPHSLPRRRIWSPTSLKFIHLALQSKRLDTPALQHVSFQNLKVHQLPSYCRFGWLAKVNFHKLLEQNVLQGRCFSCHPVLYSVTLYK